MLFWLFTLIKNMQWLKWRTVIHMTQQGLLNWIHCTVLLSYASLFVYSSTEYNSIKMISITMMVIRFVFILMLEAWKAVNFIFRYIFFVILTIVTLYVSTGHRTARTAVVLSSYGCLASSMISAISSAICQRLSIDRTSYDKIILSLM